MAALREVDVSEPVRSIKAAQLMKQGKVSVVTPRPVSKEEWPPNYDIVTAWRATQRARFKTNPKLIKDALAYYSTRPVEFIIHWCNTYDPRNAGTGRSSNMPFILFPKQVELVQFLQSCLTDQESGLIEKSRDMGATWVCVAFSVWMWLFWPGASIGWGSRKQELVDRLGDPDSIFEKIRITIRGLPEEFLPPGFNQTEHMHFMKVVNPFTQATITGEVGDQIGRGGRKRIYFKDESAHYQHPELIEAALADNTRVQIDISSVSGLGTVFNRRREAGVEWYSKAKLPAGQTRILVLDWRDHPDKSEKWYKQRRAQAERDGLLHILAQEVDRDYAAAVVGRIIDLEWVRAAIDAHIKLKIDVDDVWGGGLDIADGGGDSNALVLRKGILLAKCEEWGERDTGLTTRRAVAACQGLPGTVELQYDASPIGSGVKAEYNRLKDDGVMPKGVYLVPWLAGGKVLFPAERINPEDKNAPRNKDFYTNLKAQGYWELRARFWRTYQAVVHGIEHDPDTLISIDSRLVLLRKIEKELCQPTASKGTRMKLVVDKDPDGARSPNLADAIMMAYWPVPRKTTDFTNIGGGGKIFIGGVQV